MSHCLVLESPAIVLEPYFQTSHCAKIRDLWVKYCLNSMPRTDLYHDVVRVALVKDGWTITHDPFTVEFEDLTVYADLGAERLIAAQRDAQKIAIEIKVFRSPSPVTELERAVGQYYLYLTFLTRLEPDRLLYLAIPERIYDSFFSTTFNPILYPRT